MATTVTTTATTAGPAARTTEPDASTDPPTGVAWPPSRPAARVLGDAAGRGEQVTEGEGAVQGPTAGGGPGQTTNGELGVERAGHLGGGEQPARGDQRRVGEPGRRRDE